jgi:putative nucleotidyltransferase with HDIG domain
MGNFFGKIMVIDNNGHFVDGIKEKTKLLDEYPCLIFKVYQDALHILKQPKHNVRVIFFGTGVGQSRGVDELKEIRTAIPNIPVYLVSHAPEKEPKGFLDTVTDFTKIIKSPIDFYSFTQEVDELFTSKETWTGVTATSDEKNVELTLKDEGFISTPLSDFVLTPKSFFNVYIKLGPSKFIKLVNSGDPLNDEIIQNYASKGITHLYIPIEEHKKYIRLCEEVTLKTIRNEAISSDKKMTSVLNLGANIAQNLLKTGISQEKLDQANNFLNQSVSLIKNMRMKNESLKRFIDTIEMKEHTATVSFLAGMIANEVGIESVKSVKLVGIAALLHDIGLYDLDPDFKEENYDPNNEDQRRIYDQHQKHGGEILRKAGGFEETIYLAVESHHMRRRGSDQSIRTNNINVLTEIIGAADELHNVVISKHLDDKKLHYFTLTNLKNFSPQVEKAVLKILNKKKAA